MSSSPFARERGSSLERALSLRHVRWLEVDWHVLAVALALCALGLVFVRAMDQADDYFLREDKIEVAKQLQRVIVTLPALLFGLLIRPRWLRRSAWLVYVVAVVLLLLVPVIGDVRNGARRWIQLPFFDLQPSELAKIGVIVILARALYTTRLKRARDWILPLGLASLPMGLVALQPDLGTAMTIVPITLGMLYAAGARARVLFGGLALVVVLGVVALRFGIGHEYQAQRVETWLTTLSPDDLIANRNGSAFHPYQGTVAIGNGSWLGTGLGQGVANQAAHLPERDTDSIFAVIAEETGFIGTTGLLALYALLVILLFSTASHVRERFSRLVVTGVGLYFASHLFINVGVNLRLLPMTGVPLPLFSTGGSSLLVSFLALGLAVGLAAHREPSLDEDAFRD
ncbi:MAG: rod shape-determining protein RodA [Planctomycetes bacterium]|nr:rod shape-determining protein RodA [Planctomycetota bacterium]